MWLFGDIILYRGIIDTAFCRGHGEVKLELQSSAAAEL